VKQQRVREARDRIIEHKLSLQVETNRKLAQAREDAMTPEQKRRRQANRDRFPELAEFVDELRDYFPEAQVIKIEVSVTEHQANRRSH
jgi:hypothetical protein